MARLLLAEGALPDAQDARGRTPLHWAADFGHPEMVGLLMEAGAAVGVKDERGMTPLHLAAQGGHGEVLRRILEASQDVGARDDRGYTALSLAAQSFHTDVVEELLDRGGGRRADRSPGEVNPGEIPAAVADRTATSGQDDDGPLTLRYPKYNEGVVAELPGVAKKEEFGCGASGGAAGVISVSRDLTPRLLKRCCALPPPAAGGGQVCDVALLTGVDQSCPRDCRQLSSKFPTGLLKTCERTNSTLNVM